jgi:hypothetical protein
MNRNVSVPQNGRRIDDNYTPEMEGILMIIMHQKLKAYRW